MSATATCPHCGKTVRCYADDLNARVALLRVHRDARGELCVGGSLKEVQVTEVKP